MPDMHYWDKFTVNESTTYTTANVVHDSATFTVDAGYAFSGECYSSVTLNPNTGVLTFTGRIYPTATGTANKTHYEKVNDSRYRIYNVTYNSANGNYPVTTSGFEVTTRTTYSKGAFVSTVTALYDAYQNDQRNSDGFWYVRGAIATKGSVHGRINGQVKKAKAMYVKVNGQIKRVSKIVHYKTDPLDIGVTIPIPFTVPVKDLGYQKYDVVLARFPAAAKEVFGRDASNTYDLVCIHVGTIGKPCVFITAAMHGGEWQGTQYSTGFVLDLLNNTFPDQALRTNLVNNYHLVFIPSLNPWGMNNFGEAYVRTYHNANNVQLNADFAEGTFTQAESKAFAALVAKYKPFSCLDIHTMAPGYAEAGGRTLVIGNGHEIQDQVKNSIANTMDAYSGDAVNRWGAQNGLEVGLLRAFVARQENPHNIKTLSYITEIEKPVYPLYDNSTGSGIYSNSKIYELGYLFNYLYLRTSIQYLEHFKKAKLIETIL